MENTLKLPVIQPQDLVNGGLGNWAFIQYERLLTDYPYHQTQIVAHMTPYLEHTSLMMKCALSTALFEAQRHIPADTRQEAQTRRAFEMLLAAGWADHEPSEYAEEMILGTNLDIQIPQTAVTVLSSLKEKTNEKTVQIAFNKILLSFLPRVMGFGPNASTVELKEAFEKSLALIDANQATGLADRIGQIWAYHAMDEDDFGHSETGPTLDVLKRIINWGVNPTPILHATLEYKNDDKRLELIVPWLLEVGADCRMVDVEPLPKRVQDIILENLNQMRTKLNVVAQQNRNDPPEHTRAAPKI